MRLKIAARRSDLARLQAHEVAKALHQADPSLEFEFQFKASLGDLNLDSPLATMGNKGVFTEDFHEDLIRGSCDLVVHSWKDLPTQARAGTAVVATLPRADARDVLLLRSEAKDLSLIRVLSSSPRRIYNLKPLLPSLWPRRDTHFNFIDVRGNIPTRLNKLLQGEGEALIVAKAALDRLLGAEADEFLSAKRTVREVLNRCHWTVIPLSENPSAAAQGALAVEIRADRQDLKERLERVNHQPTFQAVTREREILQGHGGGCHQKIGVSVQPHPHGQLLSLRGVTDEGKILNDWRLELRHLPPTARDEDEIFPRSLDEARWFEREDLASIEWLKPLKSASGLYVARANALPGDYEPQGQFIWTAGLVSWRALARRGIWVNGCSESLGEQDQPAVELLSGKPIEWTRLTHELAAEGDPSALATYRLRPLPEAPDLRNRQHFFWASGSSFLRALETHPNLNKTGVHSCGPGRTAKIIETKLGRTPFIFLSWADWRNAVLPLPLA